jgi:hypothetical protein
MGRQLAAVWQFSQGIASGPCGLRVLPPWPGGNAPLAGQETSTSQHRIWMHLDVTPPKPKDSLDGLRQLGVQHKKPCLDIEFPKVHIQLYFWPVFGQKLSPVTRKPE